MDPWTHVGPQIWKDSGMINKKYSAFVNFGRDKFTNIWARARARVRARTRLRAMRRCGGAARRCSYTVTDGPGPDPGPDPGTGAGFCQSAVSVLDNHV